VLGGVPYISRGTEAGQAALNVSFRATTRPHSRVDAKVSTVLTQTFSPCSIDTSSSPFSHTFRALRIDPFTPLLSCPEARTASDDLGIDQTTSTFAGGSAVDRASHVHPADDLAQSRAAAQAAPETGRTDYNIAAFARRLLPDGGYE
jgi:hypothetical protein